MAEVKKVILSGSVLGVSFSAIVTPTSDHSADVSGSAGGFPVSVSVAAGDDFLSVSGTLLGKEFSLTAAEG